MLGRGPFGATAPASVIVCVTYFLNEGADETFARVFADDIAPGIRDSGVEIIGTLVTEHSPNSYPRLPVRENETVFVALLRLPRDQAESLNRASRWGADEHTHLVTSIEALRLAPTARSALR